MRLARLAAVAAAVMLAACTPYGSADPTEPAPSESATDCWSSPLTGRCADPEQPVLIVKIDDVSAARPQLSLNLADVILVEPVEGGLTRLMAVYHSTPPTTVGPVRSARITDIDLVPAFGRPGFAYSGATSKLVPYLLSATLQLVGAPQGGTGYSRSEGRAAPHDYLADYATLIDRIPDPVAARLQVVSGWSVAGGYQGGKPLDGVRVSWPGAEKSFTWNSANQNWDIWVYDQPLETVLADGGVPERATASTVFIMQTTLLDSPFRFKNGTVTPYPQTTGSGKGWVLTGGRSIYATWVRPAANELPRWFDKDGLEVAVEPGNVWWLVAPTTNTRVELDFQGAESPGPAPSESGTG